METSRCPVKYKKLTLMPTTWRKARRLVKLRKGIFVRDKVLGVYLKLKYNPIGPNDIPNENQEMILGIDQGSMFNGYTIYSKSNNVNLQYTHQLPFENKNELKKLSKSKKDNRRVRRNRLRHRLCKFEDRTKNKISNTANYYYQNNTNMIKRILNIYPITCISIEDVKFNHYEDEDGKGRSFSNIEIGKKRLIRFLKSLNVFLFNVRGKDTKIVRELLFPLRTKNKNKSIRDFNSHCIDSYAIAFLGYMELTGDRSILVDCISNNHKSIPSLVHLNSRVRFIDRVPYIVRRELFKFKAKQRNSLEDKKLPYYFRYIKGGIKVEIEHKSKLKRIRVKLPNIIKPNHGKIWSYMYTEQISTVKKWIKPYGGTLVTEGMKNKGGRKVGDSKYLDPINRNYIYYNIEVI